MPWRRWVWLALLVAITGTFPAGQVSACSLAPAPPLSDIVAGEPFAGVDWAGSVLGVYEYEHIARSPGILGDRSVTVVTRYWGEPPADLGPKLVRSGCGSHVASVGTLGYWFFDSDQAEQSAEWRSSLTLAGVAGELTAEQEHELADGFGPPVHVGVSAWDRLSAFVVAWQWDLMLLVVLVGAGVWVVRRRRAHDDVSSSAAPHAYPTEA